MPSAKNPFSASAAMAGYLFQVRFALLQGLQALKSEPNSSVSVEVLDDVQVDTSAGNTTLIQTKHHQSPTTISDMDLNLWKTFRTWIDALEQERASVDHISRIFLTTGSAAIGSALERLRPGADDDDIDVAYERLITAAAKSDNSQTKEMRTRFLQMDPEDAKRFLHSIRVHDEHPSLTDCRDDLLAELRLTAEPRHLDEILEGLEGWWWNEIVLHLSKKPSPPILCQRILRKVRDLSSSYSREQLPITPEDELGLGPYAPDDEAFTFVAQMRAIGLPDEIVKASIRDYYRSSTQRSRWINLNLILDEEGQRYDDGLKDEWKRKFLELCLGEAAETSEVRKKMGQQVFFWGFSHQRPFRNVVESWMTAGSLHSLSDREQIRWHPGFPNDLREDE